MKNRKQPVIHIIDKNSSYRKVIEGFVRVLGISKVSSSECCEELLSGKIHPDIIILDQLMGEDKITGLDFLRTYASSHFPDTRFIFLSSSTSLDIAVDSIRTGAYDYIVKSKSGLERLVKRLDNLVNAYQLSYRKKIQLRTAAISLGMFSILFALIIYLYNHQAF